MEAAVETIKLDRYPSYKDSGVEWLGEIPAHWSLIKSKYLWEEKIELSTTGQETLLSVSQYLGVNARDNDSRSESLIGYKKVKENDLVINIMLAWLGGLGLSPNEGVVSPAYSVYRQKSHLYPKFLHYLYRTNVYLDEFARRSKGVVPSRWRMYTEDFGQVLTLLPPLSEQTRIANFLDRKTAQIDQAIAQKERLIELLKERKQIAIQNAVTKGVDPNVQMKDSGLEWIGEIPEHWKVTQIKKVAQTTSGSTPQSGNVKSYYNGKIPWVRTTDLNNDELFDVPEKITEKAVRDTACKLVPSHTVCIAMYGGSGTIGKHSILRFTGTLNQALCGILPSKKLNQEYLYYYVKFYRPHWMIVAKGSRVDPNISQDQVRKMYIPIFPIQEQTAIVQYIQIQSNKIDQTIGLQEKQIDKLKELKATLINSAVTGKIKV